MHVQSLNDNNDYILCGRKEKRGNGFIQVFEAFQEESTNEILIERAMFRNGELIDFNQSDKMNAEQAQSLWKMYTAH
ncbi:hypothetical protein [Rodentibacter pneumotropicus]|uniref:Uncharacterized protein n=1 Tax=Rodentibacter pneumotropicus TaxID=758 RepID=A0A3S4Y1I5_9PAST|nr:hypothetical protein [Rodentibacter pneumotropicus]NBH76301.1 hypothetical protein [Rodentibacter pneumotropicus]THA11831.1 hypothetical protein D3M81_07535 [Rodentibacter pneumotropicus]VEH66660.1 Uncharacterised protein [Rodentibacter pneumotropicus]